MLLADMNDFALDALKHFEELVRTHEVKG